MTISRGPRKTRDEWSGERVSKAKQSIPRFDDRQVGWVSSDSRVNHESFGGGGNNEVSYYGETGEARISTGVLEFSKSGKEDVRGEVYMQEGT